MIKAKLIGGNVDEIVEIDEKVDIFEINVATPANPTQKEPIPTRVDVYIEKYKHKESALDPESGNPIEVYEFISRERAW